MQLCLISGNYYVFLSMIKNHQDPRIFITHMQRLDFDLYLEIQTTLSQQEVIAILYQECRFSPVMYLCPLFQIIPYQLRPNNRHRSTLCYRAPLDSSKSMV